MGETSLWSFLLHTSFGWEGRSFSLFDGLGWRRGAVAQGVPHFMLWSMMALGPALDNSWIRGRSGGRSGVVRGVVRLYFQHLFSFVFFLCSFFIFSFFLTDCYFFSFHCFRSFVHSVLLLLKSNHCGRMIVCNAKQCWQKSSLQCEGWALSCLL